MIQSFGRSPPAVRIERLRGRFVAFRSGWFDSGLWCALLRDHRIGSCCPRIVRHQPSSAQRDGGEHSTNNQRDESAAHTWHDAKPLKPAQDLRVQGDRCRRLIAPANQNGEPGFDGAQLPSGQPGSERDTGATDTPLGKERNFEGEAEGASTDELIAEILETERRLVSAPDGKTRRGGLSARLAFELTVVVTV